MNYSGGARRPVVLFLGPLPPPFMGPTLATQVILQSTLNDEFELVHLDTSDHRGIETLGAIDFHNLTLPFLHYWRLVVAILRRWPDLVYIPISQTTLGYGKDAGFILLSKVFGRRVVCHLRGGNFSNFLREASSLTRLFVRAVHSLVDGQIVLGETLRYLFEPLLPPERIHVVPNGKDIDFPARESSAGNPKVRILFLGNIIRTKGPLDVVHAIPLVVERCPDVEFVFCGDWYEPDLRREIEAFLARKPELPVVWRGVVGGTEKNAVIASADIFVFPTYYPAEGHPWVVVEAMAAGLPVISTDQGSIREYVLDGRNGYIVAKQDPAMIAERIVTLVRDPALRDRMGRESRRIYLEGYTEAQMVKAMARALHAVLDRTR